MGYGRAIRETRQRRSPTPSPAAQSHWSVHSLTVTGAGACLQDPDVLAQLPINLRSALKTG
jgi:hypothetical protein